VSSIAVVSFADFQAGGDRQRRFVAEVGEALTATGFFAVVDHGLPAGLLDRSYAAARRFFALPEATKRRYSFAERAGQRGFTPFGVEHARDSPAPDLKEFWQVGRVDVGADHPVHARYGENPWPAEVPELGDTFDPLYRALDRLGGALLEACALHLGEPAGRFRDMATEGDTIVRILHYPPLPPATPPGAVRAAAHEDINLITLLPSATASGLELLSNDGRWVPIETSGDVIIVDSGDMLQNVTNGLYRSTTHRVVNPDDGSTDRLSIPCFIHPRAEVDLSPLASCVGRTGGQARYPRITAGEYLARRLAEIGLATAT
jgi:isopenicillin N synthase-like dioxygenase